MKNIFFALSLFLSVSTLFAQKSNIIPLTFNKTVHLFFPAEINYYDVGSDDILIQSKDDILKLAPKLANFSETNLTVITKDHYCYSFLLSYNKVINTLTYFIKDSLGHKISNSRVGNTNDSSNSDVVKADTAKTMSEGESQYIAICRDIIKKAPAYWAGSTMKKVYLAMNNIYIHNDKLYFVVSVGNNSSINYDINYLKFYIEDKQKLKKSSKQEIEKTPIYSFNNIQTIDAKTNDHPIIFVFDKFTIDNDKKLKLELGEKKGGRNIAIDITQDLIIKAIAYK